MENIKEFLIEEATKVREWASYKPDATEDLDCWCAICSTSIFKKLLRQGLKPVFVEVSQDSFESHCFVECCGYIVDVTATQFGKKYREVNVIRPKGRSEWFWTKMDKLKVREAKNLSELKNLLKCWPRDQHPRIYNLL